MEGEVESTREELLIEVLKHYPDIYNPRHSSHRDAAMTENSCRGIAESLHLSGEYGRIISPIRHCDFYVFSSPAVEEAKKMWQQLRDAFIRDRRKLEGKTKSGAPYVPLWTHMWSRCISSAPTLAREE